MISFRYHVVSIVSVLLALAVGVVLGSGPLRGQVDTTLVDQARSDQRTNAGLESEVAALKGGDAFTDEFAKTVAPGLLRGTLAGRVVTMVVLPTARQADVTALKGFVGVAGGSVGATVRVDGTMVDVGAKQLVDELGNQLEGQAPKVTVPPDAGPYERIGTLLGHAVGTRRKGGAPADDASATIVGALASANLASVEGRVSRRGDLVLLVAGEGQGSAATRRGAGTIVATIAASLDGATAGAVLAGPVASAGPNGAVTAVRDDVAVARDVSTVDTLGRSAGQVVTVLALAGQAAGESGQYGAVPAADGPMPGARGGE